MKQVFLSYSRHDGEALADRLVRDIEDQTECSVWIDRQRIGLGETFDTRLETAIEQSWIVLVLLTRGATRPQSICRDETVYAINRGKTVVPIVVDTNVSVPLLLARRNWIDLSNDYDDGFAILIDCLKQRGNVLHEPTVPRVGVFVPLDFSSEIALFSKDFTGRQWLTDMIDRWLQDDLQPELFLIQGEPGCGKSSIAAALSLRREDVVAVHFCTGRKQQTLDPSEFVSSLVAQLYNRLPGYASFLSKHEPERKRGSGFDAFTDLIVNPCREMPSQDKPCLVVIDSLDEAARRQGETIVDVVFGHLGALPNWIRIVATTRPHMQCLDNVSNTRRLDIDRESRANHREDIQKYIASRLEDPRLTEKLGTHASRIGAQIGELADGVFLYACLTLDAIESGHLSRDDIGNLPADLNGFYYKLFDRLFPDADEYRTTYSPILKLLSVAGEPLGVGLIADFARSSEAELQPRLAKLRQVLRLHSQEGGDSYSLFHASLRQWLTSPGISGRFGWGVAEAHVLIAERLNQSKMWGGYSLRHLSCHLAIAEDWDAFINLILRPSYLKSKCETGLVADLTRELTDTVGTFSVDDPRKDICILVGESIENYAQFIEEYPQTLFQSIWNQLRWYCSPDSHLHYGRRPRISSSEETNSEASLWLSKWFATWEGPETAIDETPWISSLRPNTTQLGRNQEAVLFGHHGAITVLSLSPDGEFVASGSIDGTVRVWDFNRGIVRNIFDPADVPFVSWSDDSRGGVITTYGGKRFSWDLSGQLLESASSITDEGCLAMSGNGKSLATWSSEQWRIISADTGETLAVINTARDVESNESSQTFHARRESDLRGAPWNAMESIALNGDGSYVAIAESDGIVRAFDVLRQVEVFRNDQYSGQPTTAIAVSDDCARIVVGLVEVNPILGAVLDNRLVLLDAETGARIRFSPPFDSPFSSACFSRDGHVIVTGSIDGSVTIWKAESLTRLSRFRGHHSKVTSVVADAKGRKVIAGAEDGTIRVYDALHQSDEFRPTDHRSTVTSVVFSGDGGILTSGGDDGKVRVWDPERGIQLACLGAAKTRVTELIFSPDNRRLAAIYLNGLVLVWDSRRGDLYRVWAPRARWCNTAMTFYRQKLLFACGSRKQPGIWVWETAADQPWRNECRFGLRQAMAYVRRDRYGGDVASGRRISHLEGSAQLMPGSSIAFSPDCSMIACESVGRVHVWERETGKQIAVLSDGCFTGKPLVFSQSSQLVASNPLTGNITIWDVARRERVAELAVPCGVDEIGFSADESCLTAACKDGHTRMWQIDSGDLVQNVVGVGECSARGTNQAYCALSDPRYTCILETETESVIASFPSRLEFIASHPNQHTWAGASGNHLHLIKLEGIRESN